MSARAQTASTPSYSEPGFDPSEIIMGGPHVHESAAQAEAKKLATDFGARLLHHGWGH